jgi:S1-C subfamily serine protease
LLAAVDGQNAASLRNLAEALSNKKKGQTVELTVVVPRRLGGYVELHQGTVELDVRE